MKSAPPMADLVLAIERHERFLVATHVRPDGDAIGSLLGLTRMLRKLGKQADPCCQDPVPPAQEFLAGSREVRHAIAQPSTYDVAILVDCGGFERVGNGLAEGIRKIPFVINIDHHVNDVPFGNVFWVRPSASSTCEMLYDLAVQLQLPLDSDLAAQLYTGLLADTGSFRFSNTNRRVLQIAAELVAAGAQPAAIAEQTYESATPQSLRLLSRVLATITFFAGNRLATARLTQDMLAETQTSPVDSEGFINHLRAVKTVDLAMLFREDRDGVVHISLRSKGEVDVAAFAKRHGGGGHVHAAAFRVAGNLDSIQSAFTREAMDYLAGA